MSEGLDIRFGHAVDHIEWGQSGATVKCKGGSLHHADAVIITVSLGVLKVKVPPAKLVLACAPANMLATQ